MAIAIWSYPKQKHFKAVKGDLRKHKLLDTELLKDSFIITPYKHFELGFYSIAKSDAQMVKKAKDWLIQNLTELKQHEPIEELPEYTSQIDFALFELNANDNFEKVVFSRCKDQAHAGFNFHWLDQLRLAYPNAFISLVSDENLGTWITASPELYLHRNESELQSFSLAGTKFGQNTKLGAKEQEEQGIVTDFIVEAFETSGLETTIKNGIEHQAGSLTHLLNVVQGSIKNKPFDLQMLILGMHPTPAVCGFPRQWAKDFINFEGYDRELYTGFLGEFRNENDFELYVNLRCAQVFDSQIRFYAGAGITRHSVAEKEFLETEAKMSVLQSVLLSHQ
ncbi:MAG: chorismate-binding protein [Bacteroidia bacterium]